MLVPEKTHTRSDPPKPCPDCGQCPSCGGGGYVPFQYFPDLPAYPAPYPWNRPTTIENQDNVSIVACCWEMM